LHRTPNYGDHSISRFEVKNVQYGYLRHTNRKKSLSILLLKKYSSSPKIPVTAVPPQLTEEVYKERVKAEAIAARLRSNIIC
jgi:hypothetical protein